MILEIFLKELQAAFDEGFDSVAPGWRQMATVGDPATDFAGGCETYGRMCQDPTPEAMRNMGCRAAELLNEVVAEAGPCVIRFLNGEQRPQLTFSEEDGHVVVRGYFDFGVTALAEAT